MIYKLQKNFYKYLFFQVFSIVCLLPIDRQHYYHISWVGFKLDRNKKALQISDLQGSGGVGGNRTRVQTYSPKAFYMFIYALGCRDLAGA